MNSNIITAKNNQQVNPFEQRLAKLEAMLEKILASFDRIISNNSLKTIDNKINSINNVNPNNVSIRIFDNIIAANPNSSQKNIKNNLLLSQSQIISEISSALSRQNNRD